MSWKSPNVFHLGLRKHRILSKTKNAIKANFIIIIENGGISRIFGRDFDFLCVFGEISKIGTKEIEINLAN